MNKAEFFKTLRSLLRTMPEQDCEKVIAFYEEMISDRMEEGMHVLLRKALFLPQRK